MSPAELETEVRDLAARRDIGCALCNYMRGQDRLMPDLQKSAFHEDAWVDVGIFAGKACDFVDFAQGLLATFRESHHFIGQVDIQVRDRVADGEVYYLAQHRWVDAEGTGKDLFVAGRYVDRYEDRGRGWRIARRTELVDWVRTDPASDSFLRDTPQMILGARGAADFSNVRRWP